MLGGVGKSGSPIARCTMLRPWASSLRAFASNSKAVSVPISSIRRANFMTLPSHAERSQIAAVRRPADVHVLDAGRPGSTPKLAQKLLQRASAALGLHFYDAIDAIADIPLEAQLPSMMLGKEAETNPLNVTGDLRLESAATGTVVTRQSGVRERGRRDHDGDVLRRVGDRLERAANDRQIGLDELARRLLGGRGNNQVLLVAVPAAGGPFPQVVRRVGQVQTQEELELLPDSCRPLHCDLSYSPRAT